MKNPTGFARRSDQLASRGDELQILARRLFYTGFGMATLAALSFVPSAASNGAFTDYVSIPSALIVALRADGAPLTRVPDWVLANGGAVPRAFIFAIPVAVLLWKLLGKVVPQVWVRVLIVWTSPFWLGVLLSIGMRHDPAQVEAARVGVIADRPGEPKVPQDGTFKRFTDPYVLRPDTFTPALADQARYVLAQQAYLSGDPVAVATQLRDMNGDWRPVDEHSRTRLGILAEYAEASGEMTGHPTIEAGAAVLHTGARRIAAMSLAILASLMIVVAITVGHIGEMRAARAVRFRKDMQKLREVGSERHIGPAAH